ncbi:MAG TPA: hypothetical protein VFZ61_18230, partial [Polyangiales bacterium]
MIRQAVKAALVCLLFGSLGACSKEVTWIPATQVIVTVRSDLGDELRSVEASIYDVRGEELGGRHLFQLDGSRTLPLSFSVVPRTAQSNQFLIVLSGRGDDSQEMLQTRAIVSFVDRSSVGVQLWLYAGCKGLTCEGNETCTAADEQNRVACTPVPVLETAPVVPGQELDAAVDEPPAQDGAGPEADADPSPTPDASQPVPDAGPDADAESDASEPPPPSPCSASAGQAFCSDQVLTTCNAQGQIAAQETCTNARQCQLGVARAKCADCEPGAYRCTGARLDRCADDGLAWNEFKTCASEALCNVPAGDCTASACTAATRTCMGDDLFGCNQDLTALVKREECDAGMCDQLQGQCDVCTPSSRACQDDAVAACDMDGQNLSITSCPSATPKCMGN